MQELAQRCSHWSLLGSVGLAGPVLRWSLLGSVGMVGPVAVKGSHGAEHVGRQGPSCLEPCGPSSVEETSGGAKLRTANYGNLLNSLLFITITTAKEIN